MVIIQPPVLTLVMVTDTTVQRLTTATRQPEPGASRRGYAAICPWMFQKAENKNGSNFHGFAALLLAFLLLAKFR